MNGQQQPLCLGIRADECMDELQALKRRAQHAHQTSLTRKELLIRVSRDVEDHIQSLQAWITEYSGAEKTDDERTVESANDQLEFLYTSVGFACDSLKNRLRYRRRYLIGFLPGKRQVLLPFQLLVPSNGSVEPTMRNA